MLMLIIAEGLPLMILGQYDQAILDYDHAISINKGYYRAYYNKAVIYEKLDCIMEAVEAYKSFIKYAPNNYLEYINIAKQRIIELLKYK